MNTKKISILSLAAAAVLVILYFVFHHHKPRQATETGAAVRNITISALQKKDVNDFYEAAGTIQAKTISIISSRIMGTVIDVIVKQGDKVTAGQELLLIENNDLAQRIKAAQASYNEAIKAQQTAQSNKTLAETTYKRYKQLYDQKALTGQEMDQITNQRQLAVLDFQRTQATVEAAKANLSQAQINFDFSRITSPIDGVITHKNIDKGTMAVPGTPLLTVEDNSGYKGESNIDESMANLINVSMPVEVAVDSVSTIFEGTVSEIVPSIDISSRTFAVKALITKNPNERLLRNGLYARMLIPWGKISILAVPSASIVRRGQLAGIYMVGENNRITYRMIRTARTYGNDIEVLSGLNVGDRIVSGDVNNVYEGDTIGNENN
jgi:RND family efflux transporter MFP subunit